MDSLTRLLDLVVGHGEFADQVRHLKHIPARESRTAPWPAWLQPEVKHALTQRGHTALWAHQSEVCELVRAGRHTIIATGTASGKSLAYTLPVLDAIAHTREQPGRGATALYLAPTKALAADQLKRLEDFVLPGFHPGVLDGDTSTGTRDWVRGRANFILSNPDMLHYSLLPQHARFSGFLRSLRYLVIDEAHRYRGVFGSHVALIIRRLLRLCAHYGSTPTVIGASATVGEPEKSFSRLIRQPVTAVTNDASPRAAGAFVLWEPPLEPDENEDGESWSDLIGLGGSSTGQESWPEDGGQATGGKATGRGQPEQSRRASPLAEAARMLIDSTCANKRALGFVNSRRGAETLAALVRHGLGRYAPELQNTVAAYRGGYLPEERRLLETGMRNGRLRAIASTSALELGIDISGLDLVVSTGWPGTLASLWQQAGRAGRAGKSWISVFVANDDPLDHYVVNHPDTVFGTPLEATVIDPGNPYVLAGHLCAAAAELALTSQDLEIFPATASHVLAGLVSSGYLRERPTGWFWAHARPASAMSEIRGSAQSTVRLVEESTGTLLGTVEDAGKHHQSHPGAVYVHQGITYVITSLDADARVALLQRENVDYSTEARATTSISISETLDTHLLPSGQWVQRGTVQVNSQVTGYVMRLHSTGGIVARYDLDLPVSTLTTQAVWWTASADLLEEAEVDLSEIAGACHAAEHASIALLPLFANCDRWDIGGVSSAQHPETGKATVFVHDGQAGGAGFASRGYDVFTSWQQATLDVLEQCPCTHGCPACVQSPKCGNGNEPLAKAEATRLLRALLRA